MTYFIFVIGAHHRVETCFALIPLKLLLVQFLRQYNILPDEKLERPMALHQTNAILSKAIYIKLGKK